MHDTFLLNNILKSINEISIENNIKKINGLTIAVNHNSHIDEKDLKEHLIEFNKNLIDDKLDVEIKRNDTEEQTAVILSISGEKY